MSRLGRVMKVILADGFDKTTWALREWHQRAASLVTAFNQSPEAFGKHVQYKKVGQFLLVFGQRIKNGILVWLGMPWKTCKDSLRDYWGQLEEVVD